MKPLNWLKVSRQARRHFDEEELRQLGESLKVKQLQPIVARPDGTIIAGERRYRAAMLVGLKELMVILSEEPLTETQIRVFQLMENIHRADLRDGEKFRACEELVRLNPHWTNQDLSSHLHLSESTITKYLSPARCIKDVQDALEEGGSGSRLAMRSAVCPPRSRRNCCVSNSRASRVTASPNMSASRRTRIRPRFDRNASVACCLPA